MIQGIGLQLLLERYIGIHKENHSVLGKQEGDPITEWMILHGGE